MGATATIRHSLAEFAKAAKKIVVDLFDKAVADGNISDVYTCICVSHLYIVPATASGILFATDIEWTSTALTYNWVFPVDCTDVM
jgi:hypothetical protein